MVETGKTRKSGLPRFTTTSFTGLFRNFLAPGLQSAVFYFIYDSRIQQR